MAKQLSFGEEGRRALEARADGIAEYARDTFRALEDLRASGAVS